MVTIKITQKCEPCEPLCEPFSPNGSHAKALNIKANYTHVNDVNRLLVRARVEKYSFLFFLDLKNTKNEHFLTRGNYPKSFTSFTFLKMCI